MADCTNCGTWNPDDKDVCWRCQTKLPIIEEKKKKGKPAVFFGLPAWTWVIVVLLFLAPMFSQCFSAPAG
jgi:predicted nucleic acid-binding Zn ribbon protein